MNFEQLTESLSPAMKIKIDPARLGKDYAASYYVEVGALAQQLDQLLARLINNPVVDVTGSLKLEIHLETQSHEC